MVAKAGIPEKPPLIPPGHLGYAVAGGHGAFATLAALYQRAHNGGHGQTIDLSINEAIAQVSDWSMPNASVMMRAGMAYGNEVRNGSGPVYTIFACKGGYVRLVILSPRQWRAMRAWLGEPDYLQDPELESFPARLGIADAVLNPLYEQHFATMTMEEVSAEAQRRGIVCTPVLTPHEVLTNEHFTSRRTFLDTEVAPGVSGPHHAGFFEIDGDRAGFRFRAPELGEHTDEILAEWTEARPAPTGSPTAAAPLEGLRVMDFGHGGVGVEAGRLLAEYGADVIKIESITYPDFMRVVGGTLMSPSFASSSRSKRSLGVNAKAPEGNALLKELAARSDVVIENNSTGTMDSMGVGYRDLSAVNPGIVMTSSQLLGSRARGPTGSATGRAPSPSVASSISGTTTTRTSPRGAGRSSRTTTWGGLCAVGALAELLGRERTGRGGHVEVAQAEVAAGVIGDLMLAEGLAPGSIVPTGNRRDEGAPWGMYPCAGEQQWIAITVRDDADWAGLVEGPRLARLGDRPGAGDGRGATGRPRRHRRRAGRLDLRARQARPDGAPAGGRGGLRGHGDRVRTGHRSPSRRSGLHGRRRATRRRAHGVRGAGVPGAADGRSSHRPGAAARRAHPPDLHRAVGHGSRGGRPAVRGRCARRPQPALTAAAGRVPSTTGRAQCSRR